MTGPFAHIRADERRDVWGALLTLFGVMSAHSVLETARDALFVASVPAENLPWVYLAIVAIALPLSRLRILRTSRGGGVALGAVIAVAAIGTGVLWLKSRSVAAWEFYALYVWSGVVSTVVVVRFWTTIDARFTVRQAKRLFALIGSGSVAGAIFGSALATALSWWFDERHLIGAAALILVATSVVSATILGRSRSRRERRPERGERHTVRGDVRLLARRPYARRVALLVLAGAIALTLADYIFKSVVADSVPPERLGLFFAVAYLVWNVLSLIVQIGLVSRIVRGLGMHASLAVLPGLMAFGGLGLAVGGGLVAAMLMKTVDGSLRHSLHRTASEVTFVPIPEDLRERFKAVIDVVGQRGGQALASIAILATVAAGASVPVLGAGLAVLSMVWLIAALDLRAVYADQLRGGLSTVADRPGSALPELDLDSFEKLVTDLSSSSDQEVLAAIELLSEDGRASVVPTLLVHHRSTEVVERMARLLADTERTTAVDEIRAAWSHAPPRVQARLEIALVALDAKPPAPSDGSAPILQATRRLLVDDGTDGDEASLIALVGESDEESRRAVAFACTYARPGTRLELLSRLLDDPSPTVANEALRAVARRREIELVPAVLRALGDRHTRAAARDALASFGEDALQPALQAFDDPTLSLAVRWALPRAIGHMGAPGGPSALLQRLADEGDGMVRFKILRELERLRLSRPNLRLDQTGLRAELEKTLRSIERWERWRQLLAAEASAFPRLATDVHSLLVRLLTDKITHGRDRILRLLGLLSSVDDATRVRRSLDSPDPDRRAEALELLELVLPRNLREEALAVFDEPNEPADGANGDASGALQRPADYAALLAELMAEPGDVLSYLAARHAAEIDDADISTDRAREIERQSAGSLAPVVRYVVDLMQPQPAEPSV